MTNSIFENRKTKKMFEAENYTQEEFRNFMKSDFPIQSRNNERVMYQLTNGHIVVINKR